MNNHAQDSVVDGPEFKDEKGSDISPTPPLKVEDVEQNGSMVEIDAATEARLLRKLDIRITSTDDPVVNIGNARLYEMETDLGMDPNTNQFQIAVSILFVTYVIFETPSNLILKRMKPARYLAGLMFLWGLVATFSAFVTNFAGLVACRLLLGMFEAGLFPGVILYLSMFYNRRNVSLRQAWFYGTSALAGGLGGVVAYAIGEMDGVGGWNGWRWIIVINGIPTVLTAIAVPFVLPNSPETASFLTEEDRRNLVLLRMREIGQTTAGQELLKEDVMKGVKDWKVYAYAVAQFVGLGMLYSFSVFLPTIINGLGGGWNRQVVQALTIPVYIAGFITYVAGAYYSDKTQNRGLFCIAGLAVSMIGYIFLIANKGLGLSFAGCFIVALGLWVATGIAFSWIGVNNPRYGKRAFASGMQITIGNCSGVVAPFLYAAEDAPQFTAGYGATIGLLALGIAIYVALHLYFRMKNQRKLSGKEDWRIEGKTEEEIAEMGEDNPSKILDPSALVAAQTPWTKAFQTSRAEHIPVLRQDFSYTIEPTEHQNEFFGETHDTKLRGTYYNEMESVERKYDDVNSLNRHSGRHSSPSSQTAVRSDRSSSTPAADEKEAQDRHDISSAEKEENTEVDDTERQFDSGYEGGEESQGEGSETSSHTLGWSEGSSCTLGRVKEEDEHTEEGESDDEGDLFAQSYRNGSRK
ncbi:hypothetical protein J4E82_006445 [Alternaria postmessia]|uniref:uncharacterized protein n=1 Tax=Alternaria postmessia TaxID=1187938 RepID=UPI00222511E8|nr:uncharacterized protein J4E82_006445 [Alternaria postmessia]KAI5374768.1 hypothetical protein J4E82_006445 [Alternaria postmessia]